ncbi:hypothetical protein F5877DRAFT_71810 [Lentinula edodes]|nr:hypothetical protein F5877DRAFT_71810 [Lentinula edodes]
MSPHFLQRYFDYVFSKTRWDDLAFLVLSLVVVILRLVALAVQNCRNYQKRYQKGMFNVRKSPNKFKVLVQIFVWGECEFIHSLCLESYTVLLLFLSTKGRLTAPLISKSYYYVVGTPVISDSVDSWSFTRSVTPSLTPTTDLNQSNPWSRHLPVVPVVDHR